MDDKKQTQKPKLSLPSGSNPGVPIITLVGLGVILVVAAFLALNSFTIVDAGTRGVVKTFGEVTQVFPEGLHFRRPFITTVTLVDIKTQRFESASTAASKDLQNVRTEMVLNYRVNPEQVGELIERIGPDYETVVIDPAIQESVKAATAEFNAEQLITQRPAVSQGIEDVLVARLEPRGIEVQEVSITDFGFQEEFSRAIEQKQVAEQDALRAERELERARIEAQQQVARAEAEAASRRAVASADADALLLVAQAEAEALRIQAELITPRLLQLRFIERWNGIMPRILSGSEGVDILINLPAEDIINDEINQLDTVTAAPTPTPTPVPTEEPEEEEQPTATPEQ